MPCKYGGPCESRNKSGELFKSPVAYGSKLGKYTGTVNKQTAIERQGYAMTTRFSNAIKDKQGLIAFINRRELLRGPSDYYKAQKEALEKEIEDLKKQRDEALKRNQDVTDIIVNNAGKMIPASIFNIEFGIPVQAEGTQTEEQGIEGEAPDATPLPEESGSESSEAEEKTNKQLVVISYFQNTEPDRTHEDIEKQVMDLSDEDLDAYYDMAQQSNFEPPGFKTMKESLPQ